jgi:AraC-like DNA-binding protein
VELTHKKIQVVGASIFPMFLSVLFRKNPFELINKFSPLDDADHFVANVESLLATSECPYPNIISLFETFVSERLSQHELKDDFFRIYEKLTGPEGYKNNVEDIARWLGYSSRYLNSRFQKSFGMSPKKFISLVRFNHALKEIYAMRDDKNLSYIAHEIGYHDQSHFIRDFRKICGKTPKELLRNVDSLAGKFVH